MSTTRRRRPSLGNYYANASIRREDGKQFGHEVARQARTLRQACRALTESGHRGYVQVWSEAMQQRQIVAERDEAGNWWAPNPFTGNLDPFDPEAVAA